MEAKQAFFDAVKAGDLACVKELLDADASLVNARSESGDSPILLAVFYGRQEVRDFLLARGIELDIFEAAAVGNLERVAALIAKDSGLANAFSPQGFPPLGLAAFCGQPAVVEFLLHHGSDVNAVARNATGYTALTGAVAGGQVEIAAQLLAAGANANHRYAQGYSPLHSAAGSGNARMVSLLLDHGADPAACTDDGRAPLALAESKGHKEAVALLRQRAAKA
jgi:ankyrin repeat protein